jgi:hypothetical protein
MDKTCNCGEPAENDEDLLRCAADNHRRAKLRLARARLEVLEVAHRDEDYFQALAELTFMESQSDRTPDVADVIDLIHTIEEGVALITESTGVRPTTMILGEVTAETVRAMGDVFPATFGRTQPPHQRPMSHGDVCSDSWLGQIAGVDFYTKAEDAVMGSHWPIPCAPIPSEP